MNEVYDNRGLILPAYIFRIIPKVNRLLTQWQAIAAACPDPVLREQALSSLHLKAFHCQGGAVYALMYPGCEKILLELITAYQTLCDYLDNLCDRTGTLDGQAFALLHQSLLAALDPEKPLQDYYSLYPFHDDGGYILALVEKCRSSISELPSYSIVQQDILILAAWYSDLQVKKHLACSVREKELIPWAEKARYDHPVLKWQEFAAAAGSTLAIFALFAMASRNNLSKEELKPLLEAYFPWICGLHILLDYFIDREEDKQGGDLNFTFYYANEMVMQKRLELFTHESMRRAKGLSRARFHTMVVIGLLAMYLSDNKIPSQHYQGARRRLLNIGGLSAWTTYYICCLVRKFMM
ncbi:tetraprenyl-beta-curcumene synthase family protein [Syntrophomonas palmitatica]|uniref:tetraprenyl-beta-curcumene synthase family protein n=1 Tax=Syntrophomonas palmitatica TaxID=402877 RepID=UPI0006D21CE2|nr:tetraprenyl-beta-curcumene synthase family protein [Syntrophomonas palmitatica]